MSYLYCMTVKSIIHAIFCINLTNHFRPFISRTFSDPHLNEAVDTLKDNIMEDLISSDFSPSLLDKTYSVFFSDESSDVNNSNHIGRILSNPTMGKHRPKENAIFSFVDGNFDYLALFILSARKSGFEGDIVLNIPKRQDLEPKLIQFLEYHAKRGVVVYESFDIEFSGGKYEFLLDRDGVKFEVARFE